LGECIYWAKLSLYKTLDCSKVILFLAALNFPYASFLSPKHSETPSSSSPLPFFHPPSTQPSRWPAADRIPPHTTVADATPSGPPPPVASCSFLQKPCQWPHLLDCSILHDQPTTPGRHRRSPPPPRRHLTTLHQQPPTTISSFLLWFEASVWEGEKPNSSCFKISIIWLLIFEFLFEFKSKNLQIVLLVEWLNWVMLK